MGTTTNIFLRISHFTTIFPQCGGSPCYQIELKIAGTEILLTFLILPEASTGSLL